MASELLAEACLIFGWSLEECLKMPASRFFAMLRAGRKIVDAKRIRKLHDLTDVAAISIGDFKYYKSLKNAYEMDLDRHTGHVQAQRRALSRPFVPVLESGTEDARRAMFSFVGGMRG